jgi:hypothetical protein
MPNVKIFPENKSSRPVELSADASRTTGIVSNVALGDESI